MEQHDVNRREIVGGLMALGLSKIGSAADMGVPRRALGRTG